MSGCSALEHFAGLFAVPAAADVQVVAAAPGISVRQKTPWRHVHAVVVLARVHEQFLKNRRVPSTFRHRRRLYEPAGLAPITGKNFFNASTFQPFFFLSTSNVPLSTSFLKRYI